MKRLLVVLVLVVGLALCSCATMNPASPLPTLLLLPDGVLIVPPDPNLPPEIKAFSGKWGGTWFHLNMDAVLVIEKIDERQEATVVYVRGESQRRGMVERWFRVKGNFSRNKEGGITLSWISPRTGLKFEFRVKGDTLEGVSYPHSIIMRRLQ